MSNHTRKTYTSEARKKQSQETRKRIILGAKKLFEAKGFENVTVDEIAQSSKISAPSIYSIFRSKRGILLALMDDAFSSEKRSTLVDQVINEKSPYKKLHIVAKISRELYDAEKSQLNILRSAMLLDPTLKELDTEREKRRYQRQKETVMTIAKEKAFVDHLSLSKIKDILWAFTGRDFYRMLVIDRKWSSNEYEKWLANILTSTLLKK